MNWLILVVGSDLESAFIRVINGFEWEMVCPRENDEGHR